MEATVRTRILFGNALTWWNGQIRTLGPKAYAMTWEVLKKTMTDKYCPQGQIQTYQRRAMGQLPKEMGVLSVEHQDTSREIVRS
ncbi:hypothetical protein Tco_0306873 [Tanacetum coccineum]